MNIFNLKKASNKISAKKDLDAVVSYLKTKFKSELDSARFKNNNNMGINLEDTLITEASQLLYSVINDFDEINKRTDAEKKSLKKTKTKGTKELSPDEIYMINMSSIHDIKKAGLKRLLSTNERMLLKNANNRFVHLYSEQIKSLKTRD
ncbi:MAG: hypothetical protein JW974_02605 [Alphaproteobacteria bacterium]|nr:hypothetical protein [Alphaproteobacteria bacterium]MBN2675187.1 hypothetical protein [Alphaproteobacteria bacterium]